MKFSIKCWPHGSPSGKWASIIAAMNEGTGEEEIISLARIARRFYNSSRVDLDDRDPDGNLRLRISVIRGSALDMTAEEMELLAIVETIRAMKKPCKMQITSRANTDVLTRGAPANTLIREYREFSRGFKIEFERIENHILNDWAAQIATYEHEP